MGALLGFSNGVDRLNTWLNKYVIWLILIATLVSAVNALVRKIFNTSSNAFLEIQWYFFAASFFCSEERLAFSRMACICFCVALRCFFS